MNDLHLKRCWPELRRLFARTFASSYHFAIASVDETGAPHVTPIGSVLLGEPGHLVYFEEFPTALPCNIQRNPRVCILAVNSNPLFWLSALARRRFSSPPGVRLYGSAATTRDATEAELARWRRRVRWLRRLPGYRALWGAMNRVRDVQVDGLRPIELGTMTRGLWHDDSFVG